MKNSIAGNVYFAMLFGALILAIAPWARAQELPKQGTVDQKAVSDKELRAFAKAYVEFHQVRRAYESRMNGVEDTQEKAKIRQEGNSKVAETLQKNGLTAQSYNRLFASVNANQQLRKKALKIIEEERKNS